jgi:hypothetical protein
MAWAIFVSVFPVLTVRLADCQTRNEEGTKKYCTRGRTYTLILDEHILNFGLRVKFACRFMQEAKVLPANCHANVAILGTKPEGLNFIFDAIYSTFAQNKSMRQH